MYDYLKLRAVDRAWNRAHPENQVWPAVVLAVLTLESTIFHKFLGGQSNRMTEMTKSKLDEVEARLVELGTDAGNASEVDDVPPPLESDVSSDEGEDEDSTRKGMVREPRERLTVLGRSRQ